MENASETWQRVDELSDVYGRLTDRRKAVWQQMIGHRMAGAHRQAARVESELERLDYQGLRLAEHIASLAATPLITSYSEVDQCLVSM